MTLRSVRTDDYTFLREVYATTRVDELRQAGWGRARIDGFIDMQFRAQDADYRHRFPNAAYELIELDGEPVGRLYVHRRVDEIRILDMTIMPAHRGQGIGKHLIVTLIDEARLRLGIYLENHSRSIQLFQRLGFTCTKQEDVYALFAWRPA
ncbi:MAG: GNAT family N-acetyltransferase [Phycisphaerae bacterium]